VENEKAKEDEPQEEEQKEPSEEIDVFLT
jgi:hypothetical protein